MTSLMSKDTIMADFMPLMPAFNILCRGPWALQSGTNPCSLYSLPMPRLGAGGGKQGVSVNFRHEWVQVYEGSENNGPSI